MRYLASWALFWPGHWVSLLLNLNGNGETWCGFWYPIYNSLMLASAKIQGDGPGPWEDAYGNGPAE